ncbi:GTPase-activating protein and VPS9 domain-containing protein 1-like [Hydractinia symbiolongicarpus]|uniref:GTPase-activating protein and VPS9 domain-containing protein 1-like n=1 Tax=Hydractinia symbiolongicarpus TaxID=13093 RepID=UPI00254F4138|nr:GTPase-activating protein and VPS9 domain-containing protein 1-like [Hydractinia symbiolongicarpus]
MADEVEKRKCRFLTLQKRLKEERLFVKQEKEQLRKLNDKVTSLSQNLFYLEWKTRHQWINVDRLVNAKINPSDCSTTSRIIESVKFEDASSALNYEDGKYGEFLFTLKQNPKLVAMILDYCDTKRIKTTTRHLTRLLISSLYGSCSQRKDEVAVLKILKELMSLQVLTCEDLLSFFCGKRSTENAFACVLTLFSEMLFSSKLYLTAALHGTVMQVIVDDAIFLDVEVSKVLVRIPPKAIMDKFGKPGTASSNSKIKDHMNTLHNHLINLCKKFLKSLHDKIYCFPQSLRWAIGQLYQGMILKMKLPSANAKAIIAYMIMSYFICPAIINPEPYGINSDADISETARHNLSQVASILRSLALLECGLKDEKFKVVLERFDQGFMMSYVSSLLNGAENIDMEFQDEVSASVVQSSILITEHDLKTLINCLKLLQTYEVPKLNEEGLEELLDVLPAPPRRWTKEVPARNVKSMPPNLDISTPVPPPRNNKLKKLNSSSSPSNASKNQEDIEQLKVDLNKMITNDEPVLVVPLGNEIEQYPGMLSEEKVLGLNTNLSTAYDIDTTDEERRRRASSLMLDALHEFFPQENLIDINDMSNVSSDSDIIDSKELNSVKQTSSRAVELDGVFFEATLPPKATSDNAQKSVPVDNLLDFGQDSASPRLPVKKHHSKHVSSGLIDQPLISLENDIFVDSSKPLDLNSTSGKSELTSMISGDGGINAILQAAAIPSPTAVKNSEFQDPWSPSVTGTSDPWSTSSTQAVTPKGDETKGFESNFTPVTTPTRKTSQSGKKKHSVDPKYAAYSENIQREKKLSSSKMVESNSHEEIVKLARKKSHGAWFKDKISTKLGGGLRQTPKKSDNFLKKDRKVSETHTDHHQLKAGTPMQASVASKVKSASIISRGSGSEVDVSEAIMAKYRNMTLESSNEGLDQPFGTPHSSQMEDVAMQVHKDEVIFDDEFKFEDAKKKLRTVLCTSDQTLIPSDARSFDHLMLTMLQAKLAEAINIQNRFSVAQLHETLRSIKQLPDDSCEKLVQKLEEDYEQRSKYISYLTRSKQGLLSTICHLEQTTTKLQRDKVICRKYFTTLAVRLFLETQERKKEIIGFGQNFNSTKMLDEKCALLSDFLEKLHVDMLKDATWTYCNDEELEDVKVATERTIMSRIYKEAFYPNGVTDIENDRIFHEHIKCLSKVITLSHPALQIPKTYQKEAPWPSAQTELLMVNAYKTAADKLACIHRCCVTIMNLLSMASDKQAPGADDFVPVLVYVVLRANPPNLLSTKQYVNTFYETRLSGEEYYCWMQFCAALEFIKTMTSPER